MTEMVRGQAGLETAQKATEVLFGGEIEGLSAAQLLDIFAEVPSTEIPRDRFAGGRMPLVQLLVAAGAASSNGEARRLIQGGGVYLNNRRAPDTAAAADLEQAADGRVFVLRRGARSYFMVHVV
ncbi:MAG: S4 domain-containing protein, partial [Dehalococcoidia bacterium]